MLLEWWLRPRESCLNGRIQFRVENCYKLSRRMYSSRQTWFGTYLWKLVIFRMVKLFSLIWKWIVQVLVLVDEKNVVDCFWFSLMGWWSQLGICTFFWMRNIWMSQQLLRNNPPKMTHFIFLSFFKDFFRFFEIGKETHVIMIIVLYDIIVTMIKQHPNSYNIDDNTNSSNDSDDNHSNNPIFIRTHTDDTLW